MFVWSLPTVIAARQPRPELAGFISELRHSNDIPATVAAQFPALTPISIDYALMENADRVLNIEATFDWDDIGSWISIAKYLEKYGRENRANEADQRDRLGKQHRLQRPPRHPHRPARRG